MDNTPHGTDAIGLDPRPSSALAYALSVREPWASLIANGEKTVENRTWAPRLSLPFRIAIHASCRPDTALCRRFGIDESRLTLGAIIATVDQQARTQRSRCQILAWPSRMDLAERTQVRAAYPMPRKARAMACAGP